MSTHGRFIFRICLVAVIFIFCSLLLPIVIIERSDLILAASTFIFSVLYGFEISLVISNFSQLKTQLAIENAGILSIHYLASILGGETFKKVDQNIETYLHAAIDTPLVDHLKTDRTFFAIFDPLKEVNEAGGDQKGQALQYLNEAIYYVPQARNQVAEVAPRFIDMPVWVMLITLASILVSVLFISRGANSFSELTAAIFATTVVGALFLLDEIDSNKIQEKWLEYDIFNVTLRSLGKVTYYPSKKP